MRSCEAIEGADFEANIVSNADDVGIIHKRIIQNLYDNPIVVCDVSGKNPNVMFELGLRLAFDKPTVIVEDDKTAYSFDTSAIEHLEYPRDLRFSHIVEFKRKLTEKIAATHKRATTDPHYTTFLKHFGEFTVAKLEKKEVSGQEYILEELQALRKSMQRFEFFSTHSRDFDVRHFRSSRQESGVDICLRGLKDTSMEDILEKARENANVVSARLFERGPDHKHLCSKSCLVQMHPN
ncbi:hypothetical protein [Caballeronia sp. M23-90]